MADTTTKPMAPFRGGCMAPAGGFFIPAAGAPTADRGVVDDGTGDIRLQLYRGDECLGDMPLGPADALRIASELLNAARRRMGR
jgi:hypothetical protein